MDEIEKQADGIELRALNGEPDFVIVAVRIFALAFVSAQGVAGGKRFVILGQR